jgi:hypothetical protein
VGDVTQPLIGRAVTSDAWWLNASDLAKASENSLPKSVDGIWYRFAQGWLCLVCTEPTLLNRFNEIYPEGAEFGPPSECSSKVTCRVRPIEGSSLAAIVFEDPEPLDSFAFCQALFPDRGYAEGPACTDGWRTISINDGSTKPFIAMRGLQAIVDLEQVWQPFVANYVVSRVLRLQRQLLFFHAGSIGIKGRGLMVTGPKNSGKTTTSMTLASRGHSFLGDEMAAVDKVSGAMFPFRRAVSIRTGPRSNRVDDQIGKRNFRSERFPDGGERILANVGEMFPDAAAATATLTSIFFLRGFAAKPAASAFPFGVEHFHMLSPLACSMWGVPAVSRMMDLAKLAGRANCYFLDLGEPDVTADLIEQIVLGGVE